MEGRVLRREAAKELMNLRGTRMPIASVTLRGRSGRYAIGYQSATPIFSDWVKIKDVTSKASGHLSEYSE